MVCFEHCVEASTKSKEFFDYVRNYQLFRKDSAP